MDNSCKLAAALKTKGNIAYLRAGGHKLLAWAARAAKLKASLRA